MDRLRYVGLPVTLVNVLFIACEMWKRRKLMFPDALSFSRANRQQLMIFASKEIHLWKVGQDSFVCQIFKHFQFGRIQSDKVTNNILNILLRASSTINRCSSGYLSNHFDWWYIIYAKPRVSFQIIKSLDCRWWKRSLFISISKPYFSYRPVASLALYRIVCLSLVIFLCTKPHHISSVVVT